MVHTRRALAVFTLLIGLAAGSPARADEPAPEEDGAESTPPAEPLPTPAPAPAPAPAAPTRRAAPPRDDDEPTWNERPRRRSNWYGWQTLISDGIALNVVLFGSSAQKDSDFKTALISSAVIFVAVPPLIHFAHERPGAAVGSLLLRGLPVFLLSQAGDCNSGAYMCANAGLVMTGVLLVPAAIAIDAAALAREPAPSRHSFVDGLSPRVSLRREGGFDVGLGGAL